MRIVVCGLLAFVAGAASADVTVCQGDECTVVSNGVARILSPDEVRSKKRDEVMRAINQIDCAFANVPPACRYALQNLNENFQGR